MKPITSLVPWYNDRKAVLAYVLSLVADGTLSIDADGRVWRHFVAIRSGRIAAQTGISRTHIARILKGGAK